MQSVAGQQWQTGGIREVPRIESASGKEISQFLARWRVSRFDLLRAGYQALTQLIQASWYDNPTSWSVIGYPGPPRLGGRA